MVIEKKTILHIDDDARVSNVIGKILRMEGYHVVSCFSAEEGLRRLKTLEPSVIILDVGMPGMSGLTVLQRLRQPDGSTRFPVLIFTAFAQMVDEDIRKSVAGFLVKPVDVEALMHEIERIIAGSEQGSPGTPIAGVEGE
jgi:CheY-like chemotaxis protein